jgi:hypothetical protein
MRMIVIAARFAVLWSIGELVLRLDTDWIEPNMRQIVR